MVVNNRRVLLTLRGAETLQVFINPILYSFKYQFSKIEILQLQKVVSKKKLV